MPYSPLKENTDVVFLLDASRGVTQEMFTREKEFVKSLASEFNLSPDGPRGSAAIYADNPYTVSSFVDDNFDGRVDGAALLNQPRRMDRVLEHAAQVLRASRRDGRKIVVLLTAGRQVPNAEQLSKSVKHLKELGVQTFVVSIGGGPDMQQIRPIVDQTQDIFVIPSSSGLASHVRPISKKIFDKPGNV